jgi:excisionase family DNA binding protein
MERNHDDAGDAYLTTGAAARRLHISKMTLLRALRRGEIAPTFRTPGGYARFRVADVDRYARQLAGGGRTP